jgi:hypothetical protein
MEVFPMSHIAFRRWSAAGLMILAGCGLACSKKGPQPNLGQALSEDVFLGHVDLSDGQVKIISPKAFLASVRFRGTRGRPAAGHWYQCDVSLRGKTNTKHVVAGYDGATMPMEGMASKEVKLDQYHEFKPGETLDFQFSFHEMSSEVNGRRTYISNLASYLEGKTQAPK